MFLAATLPLPPWITFCGRTGDFHPKKYRINFNRVNFWRNIDLIYGVSRQKNSGFVGFYRAGCSSTIGLERCGTRVFVPRGKGAAGRGAWFGLVALRGFEEEARGRGKDFPTRRSPPGPVRAGRPAQKIIRRSRQKKRFFPTSPLPVSLVPYPRYPPEGGLRRPFSRLPR